jgi:hypothetical protein
MTLILRVCADILRFYTLTGTRPRKSDQSAESVFYFLVADELLCGAR